MEKYLNFTFQKNKFKEGEKDPEWVGYSKTPDGARFYFVKIFKNNGQYGEYMSGSIDLEKLRKFLKDNDNSPEEEYNKILS